MFYNKHASLVKIHNEKHTIPSECLWPYSTVFRDRMRPCSKQSKPWRTAKIISQGEP